MSALGARPITFLFASALLLYCQPTFADSVNVTIGTAALSGTSATLAFDLVDGDGIINNSVSIANFSSDATLGTGTSTGDVSGSLPGVVTLSDTNFFNELLASVTLGSSISFTVDYSNVAAVPPDAFTFFLLDTTATNSLVTTDLLGNALLEIDMNGTSKGALILPTTISSGVTVSLGTSPAVPEPSSALLTLSGICAALIAKRMIIGTC